MLPQPAKAETVQPVKVCVAVGVAVPEGVAEDVAVPVVVGERDSVEEALAGAPAVRLGVGERDAVGEAEGGSRNITLATKPSCCTLPSLVQLTVRKDPLLRQLPRALPL